MQLDYTKILLLKYPQSEWSLNGNDYDGLTWLSNTPKPTKTELDALWDEVLDEINTEAQAKEAARQAILDRLGLTADEAKLLLG